jgi:tRNA(Ile)-lysidine synthase TilS/MesJ
MSYRFRLEARIARKTTKATVDFGLIEDGDRVMAGVSGGKDSWALLQILDVLRRHARIDFSLVAVTVDCGATKIALGHHADDVIETLLLNLFCEGTLKAMPARLEAAHVGAGSIAGEGGRRNAEAEAFRVASLIPDPRSRRVYQK